MKLTEAELNCTVLNDYTVVNGVLFLLKLCYN